MGKHSKRNQIAKRRGENPHTAAQRINILRQKHEKDLLCMSAHYDNKIQELEAKHRAEISAMNSGHLQQLYEEQLANYKAEECQARRELRAKITEMSDQIKLLKSQKPINNDENNNQTNETAEISALVHKLLTSKSLRRNS